LLNRTKESERPVSVLSKVSETASLPPPPSPLQKSHQICTICRSGPWHSGGGAVAPFAPYWPRQCLDLHLQAPAAYTAECRLRPSGLQFQFTLCTVFLFIFTNRSLVLYHRLSSLQRAHYGLRLQLISSVECIN